jgi:hypothetical protein
VSNIRVSRVQIAFLPSLTRAWGLVVDRGDENSSVEAPGNEKSDETGPPDPGQRSEKLKVHQKERGLRQRPNWSGDDVNEEAGLYALSNVSFGHSGLKTYDEEIICQKMGD